MSLYDLVKKYIADNPQISVGKIIHDDQEVWIKRRFASKENIWHKLLHYLTFIIPFPVIYPTVVSDVTDSLLQEAMRLTLLADNNIPVPTVLIANNEFLATTDVGETLQRHLESIDEPGKRAYLLQQAAIALGKLHQANLCHGRPSLRDMTYNNEQIYFIDLEEDPLSVMSAAQAQARDVWLLFFSVARQCRDNPFLLNDLFSSYLHYAKPETLGSIKKMVLFLKPIRVFVEYCLFAIPSKDLHSAVIANKTLEQNLKKHNKSN
ncbi:hypothetical protein [uncultured Legionella sp.]|uniref:hypothetical protein n=1 Tax=uncultured Legionella sp. TaxID=210934 RepID=UPI0026233476|nr:hypothetical protein [uncultured Legionella sp.]